MKEGDAVWVPCKLSEGMFIDEYFVFIDEVYPSLSFVVYKTSVITEDDVLSIGEGVGHVRMRILSVNGSTCRVLLPPLVYQEQIHRILFFPCDLLQTRPGSQ